MILEGALVIHRIIRQLRASTQRLSDQDLGERHDPFGEQFRVLHEVGGVGDDAGNEDLAAGQRDPLQDMAFGSSSGTLLRLLDKLEDGEFVGAHS